MRSLILTSLFVPLRIAGISLALLISPLAESANEPESSTPESPETSEPSGDVTIQDRKSDIVEELRVNGQLYAIRVTPKRGVPYYLVDSDGDGNLETRKNDTDSDLLIPAWVIKKW